MSSPVGSGTRPFFSCQPGIPFSTAPASSKSEKEDHPDLKGTFIELCKNDPLQALPWLRFSIQEGTIPLNQQLWFFDYISSRWPTIVENPSEKKMILSLCFSCVMESVRKNPSLLSKLNKNWLCYLIRGLFRWDLSQSGQELLAVAFPVIFQASPIALKSLFLKFPVYFTHQVASLPLIQWKEYLLFLQSLKEHPLTAHQWERLLLDPDQRPTKANKEVIQLLIWGGIYLLRLKTLSEDKKLIMLFLVFGLREKIQTEEAYTDLTERAQDIDLYQIIFSHFLKNPAEFLFRIPCALLLNIYQKSREMTGKGLFIAMLKSLAHHSNFQPTDKEASLLTALAKEAVQGPLAVKECFTLCNLLNSYLCFPFEVGTLLLKGLQGLPESKPGACRNRKSMGFPPVFLILRQLIVSADGQQMAILPIILQSCQKHTPLKSSEKEILVGDLIHEGNGLTDVVAVDLEKVSLCLEYSLDLIKEIPRNYLQTRDFFQKMLAILACLPYFPGTQQKFEQLLNLFTAYTQKDLLIYQPVRIVDSNEIVLPFDLYMLTTLDGCLKEIIKNTNIDSQLPSFIYNQLYNCLNRLVKCKQLPRSLSQTIRKDFQQLLSYPPLYWIGQSSKNSKREEAHTRKMGSLLKTMSENGFYQKPVINDYWKHYLLIHGFIPKSLQSQEVSDQINVVIEAIKCLKNLRHSYFLKKAFKIFGNTKHIFRDDLANLLLEFNSLLKELDARMELGLNQYTVDRIIVPAMMSLLENQSDENSDECKIHLSRELISFIYEQYKLEIRKPAEQQNPQRLRILLQINLSFLEILDKQNLISPIKVTHLRFYAEMLSTIVKCFVLHNPFDSDDSFSRLIVWIEKAVSPPTDPDYCLTGKLEKLLKRFSRCIPLTSTVENQMVMQKFLGIIKEFTPFSDKDTFAININVNIAVRTSPGSLHLLFESK